MLRNLYLVAQVQSGLYLQPFFFLFFIFFFLQTQSSLLNDAFVPSTEVLRSPYLGKGNKKRARY